jgi:hypothetical protein
MSDRQADAGLGVGAASGFDGFTQAARRSASSVRGSPDPRQLSCNEWIAEDGELTRLRFTARTFERVD